MSNELDAIRDLAIAAEKAAKQALLEGLSSPDGSVKLTIVARRMGIDVSELTRPFMRTRLDLTADKTAMVPRLGRAGLGGRTGR